MSVIKEGMISPEISRYDLLPISFLKKSAYTGSKRGLRYKIQSTEEGNLECITWVGAFAFDATPEDEKTIKEFERTNEGLDQIVLYLNGLLKDKGL